MGDALAMAPEPGSDRPWLRLVLAVSLDGRLAPPEGGAAQLGGRADRRVLEEALAWADGCLIGAETLRRHGTTCLIRDGDLLAQRQGRGPQPLAIAVTGGCGLSPDLPFFAQPLRRWLLTLGDGGVVPPAASCGYERTLAARGWSEALQALAEAGLRRLVVLGGARLAGSLVAEDLLDELQLSLCPLVLGGAHGWLPAETLPSGRRDRWSLIEQRLLGDGEMLLRYRRAATDHPGA